MQQTAAQGADAGWRGAITSRGGSVAPPPNATRGTAAWGTGGNIEDIENGWNTPFYDKMFAQREEAGKAGTLRDLYKRDDFTGIVTTDPEKPTDSRMKFGSIYENGQYQGNLYESPDYDKNSADWIMGRLLLDKTVFAKAQTPEQLAKEVEKARKDATTFMINGEGARQFEERVDEASGYIQENAWAQVGNIAAGAAGGAAVGAGIGSVVPGLGTLVVGAVGAVGGGIAAWMNQDEIMDQAARVQVQVEKGADEGAAKLTQIGAIASGAGELGLKYLSPVGSLVHGAYDVSQGDGIADGKAGW